MARRDVLDVWLGGALAGQMMRADDGDVEFLYDDRYRESPTSTPLSVGMPTSQAGHSPDRVMPWLSNLLPDQDEVRDRWAARFGERRNDPFTLLRHMGQDAPGAVQFATEGIEPSCEGSLTEITEERIAERVLDVIRDPDHWVDDTDADESRFSLAGTQGKFALARIGDRWFEPNGRAPSTHIVKPGMRTRSGTTSDQSQAAEFVTMRAARRLGLPTALVDIADFDGTRAFVTTRYDRLQRGSTVRRVHQEDFLQASGLLPARKYESDGGPTMQDMANLLGRTGSVPYLHDDRDRLATHYAYCLLVAGVDAHAKNLSLLLDGNRVRLAPGYDLISAFGIWNAGWVEHKAQSAVKYGKRSRFGEIHGHDIGRTADALGVDRGAFAALLVRLAGEVQPAFEASVAELPSAMVNETIAHMPAAIGAFATRIADRAMRPGALNGEPWVSRSHGGERRVAGDVWVPGHWREDSWISGRYRSRPRR